MRLLVSICNKVDSAASRFPDRFLFLVDVESASVSAVALEHPNIAECFGITGLTGYPGGYAALTQSPRPALVLLDYALRIVDAFALSTVGDPHSLCYHGGAFYIVSTGSDSIVRFTPEQGEQPFWALRAEGDAANAGDTLHLNSLIWCDGECCFTAFGPKKGTLWRSADDGYLRRAGTGETVIEHLYHPHSVAQADGVFLVCESSRMAVVNQFGRKLDFHYGYVRGLAVVDQQLCVGSGKGRNKSKSTGAAIDSSGDPGHLSGRCGIGIFEVADWAALDARLVTFLDLGDCGTEIYDILPIKAGLDQIDLPTLGQSRPTAPTLPIPKEEPGRAGEPDRRDAAARTMIFDQYSRYRACADILGAILGPDDATLGAILGPDDATLGATRSVLDVGSGPECLLNLFLPDHALTFVDPLLAESPRPAANQVVGDVFTPQLDGRRFNAVLSVDALEHVAPADRQRFLERLSALAQDYLVIACPCADAGTAAEVDRQVNDAYRRTFGTDYSWLDEHFHHHLPRLTEVLASLTELGWQTTVTHNGHGPWLATLLSYVVCALEIPTMKPAIEDLSRIFNQNLYAFDGREPGYRQIIVASRRPLDLPAALRPAAAGAGLPPAAAHAWAAIEARMPAHAFQNLTFLTNRLTGAIATIAAREAEIVAREAEIVAREAEAAATLAAHKAEAVAAIAARDGVIAHQKAHAEHLEGYIARLLADIDRERFTVLRPLARQALRAFRRLDAVLPSRLSRSLRHAGYVALRAIAPGSSAVKAYWEKAQGGRAGSAPMLGRAGAAAPSTPKPPPAPMPGRSGGAAPAVAASILKPHPTHDLTFLVFSVIPWNLRIQRPQHLAIELAAKGYRVVYIEADFGRRDADGPAWDRVGTPADNVVVCRINLGEPAVIYTLRPTEAVQAGIDEALATLRRDFQLGQIVALVQHPFWRRSAVDLAGACVVYDCMDYHLGFANTSPWVHDEEERLLQQADQVVTTAGRLSELIGLKRANVIVRNAAEVDFFARPPATLAFASGRKVVGYYGAISAWFDLDLVIAAANRYPHVDFVLVGAVSDLDIGPARAVPNIRFVGEVPYTDLPRYLYAFDVCLIPFRRIELTLCTNPVKIYEYLAAGKPVVATDLPEIRLMDAVVHVAEDAGRFCALIGQSLDAGGDGEQAARRRAWVRDHTWANRASDLERHVLDRLPKVSVVVLCYNNLDFTKSCLLSLERFTHYPDWELIIVDNGSQDDTVPFLRDYAGQHSHVVFIDNQRNLGFAAGNNVGLRAARGDVLVMLNNDTVVTEGWLFGLARHLRDHPHIGLVGPVTNNIGNEAKIDIHYDTLDDLPAAAAAHTRPRARQLYPCDRVAFFCVAMRRDVFETVGDIDERFGVGFFEDDDYCNRVRAAGYHMAIADDVFIHHHLSASFNKLGAQRKQELFDTNRKIYEEKWGPWRPHRYREPV